MLKQAFTFFPFFYFLVCSLTVKATVLPVTPEELVNGAELICIAQVKPGSMKSSWVTTPQGDRWMESTVSLTVSECLKGEGTEGITVQITGGKMGEQMERNSVSAWFEDQEQVIVFLQMSQTEAKSYIVFHDLLGKYTIDPTTNTVSETGESAEVFIDKINILLGRDHP